MKIKELRLLGNEELRQKEKSFKDELFKLNAERYAGRVEKPHKFSLIKKGIARIQTILHEKKDK